MTYHDRCVVRDSDGNVIRHSRNLRGIRQYVSNHSVTVLSIDLIGNDEGKLMLLFDDGSSYETNFASFTVLRDFVRRWRSVYGTPIRVNGIDAGIVEYRNFLLAA